MNIFIYIEFFDLFASFTLFSLGYCAAPPPPPFLCRLQGAGPDSERLRAQLQDVLRENQLLKRAVAIQNSRMQELGCVPAWPGLLACGP